MDILEQKKREIQRQYESIRASIMSERKLLNSGIISLNLLKEDKGTSENHILTESRKVFEEHSSNSARGKYLGRLKIYTPDGAKIFPCSCSVLAGSECDNPSHEEKTISRKGDDVNKYERSLASVRSERCLNRLIQDEVGSVRSGGKPTRRPADPITGPSNTGSSRFPRESDQQPDPYGFLSNLTKHRAPLPTEQQINLKGRVTENCCSFCLKKCNSLTCDSCQRLKLRR